MIPSLTKTIRSADTPRVHTTYTKLTKWETKKIYFSKEFIKYKKNIIFEAKEQDCENHYEERKFTNSKENKFNLKNNCWKPESIHPERSFENTFASENMFRNKFFFTIDFSKKTEIYEIQFNKEKFTKSQELYSEGTAECSISRYIENLKFAITICYSEKGKFIYVKRFGKVNLSDKKIKIVSEREKFISGKKRVLDYYNMLVVPSGNDKFAKLIIFKKFSSNFFSIFLNEIEVFKKIEFNFEIPVFGIKYLSNSLFVISKKDQERNEIVNYYIKMHIGESLEGKAPKIFCEGYIKNSYISKKSKKLMIEVFKLDIENSEILKKSSEVKSSENKEYADRLVYLRYSFGSEEFELVEYTLLDVKQAKQPGYFYLELIDFDVFNLRNLKTYVIKSRIWTQSTYQKSLEKNENFSPPEIEQNLILVHSLTQEAVYISQDIGQHPSFYQFSLERLRGSDIFSYFDKDYQFKDLKKDKTKICRITRIKFFEPHIDIKFNINPSKKPENEKSNITLQMMKVKREQGKIVEKTNLENHNIKFFNLIDQKKEKFKLWKGSDIKELFFCDRQAYDSILSNFVKGSFIHRIIDFKRVNLTHFNRFYKNDLLDYAHNYNHNLTALKYILKHSFLERRFLTLKGLEKKPFEIQEIDQIFGFQILNEGEEKFILFLKKSNEKFVKIYEYEEKKNSFFKIGILKVEKINKILPFKQEIVLILDSKGEIRSYNLKTRIIKKINYGGESCREISFLLHNSIELAVTCLTDSLALKFYYAEKLYRNSRSESEIPSKQGNSIDIFDFKDKKIFKALYNPFYRYNIFILFPKIQGDEENTLLIEISMKDKLVYEIKKKIKLKPPRELRIYYTSRVVDVVIVGEYFVQLLEAEIKNWICVYIFEEFSQNFKNKKCYSLPFKFSLIKGEKLRKMTSSDEESRENLKFVNKGFVSLAVNNKETRGFNTVIIDPEAPFFETVPFLLYPINSKIRFKSFKVFSFLEEGGLRESFLNVFFFGKLYKFISMKENNFLDVVAYDEPTVNFNSGDFKEISDSNILSHESVLKKDRHFRYFSDLEKRRIFEKNRNGDFELKKNLGNETVQVKVNVTRYLPQSSFILKGEFKNLKEKTNLISFKKIYKNFLKNEVIDKKEKNLKIAILSFDAAEIMKGNLYSINLKLEYERDHIFQNVIFVKPLEIQTQFNVPKAIDESKIRFRKICVKYQIFYENEKYSPSELFNTDHLPCVQNITVYLDNDRILELKKKIFLIKNSNFQSSLGDIRVSKSRNNCSVPETFRQYLIRVCENGFDVKISVINFESIDEYYFETRLNGHNIENLHIEIKGKILVITSKIGKFYRRMEFYSLQETILSEFKPEFKAITKRKKLQIDYITGIPVKIDDYYINVKENTLQNSLTLDVGFIRCAFLNFCTYQTKFRWVKNWSYKAGFLKVFKSSTKLVLEKTPSLNFASFYKGVKTAVIEADKFSNRVKNHFVLHFPNGDDFLFFGGKAKFNDLNKFTFSNPFKGIITSSSLRPICSNWLCVLVSIYEKNSYLRFYYIDYQKINSANFSEPSPYLGELDESRRLYTFSVLNYTGRICYLDWDVDSSPNLQKEFPDLSIVVKDTKNKITVIKVVKNLTLYVQNTKICSKKLSLNFTGFRNRREVLSFRMVEDEDPLIKKHLLTLVALIGIGLFIAFVVLFFLLKQEGFMREKYRRIEELKRTIMLKVLKREKENVLEEKKRFEFKGGKDLFYKENKKELQEYNEKINVKGGRRTTFFSYFMKDMKKDEEERDEEIDKVKKMEPKELDKVIFKRNQTFVEKMLFGIEEEVEEVDSDNEFDFDG